MGQSSPNEPFSEGTEGLIGILAWFSLGSSITCFLLALMVFLFNRKGLLNKIFITVILFGAYSIFTSFMVMQSADAQAAYFWNQVGFMSPVFIALLLHFSLVFTENRLANDKRSLVFVYLPAVLFAVVNLVTNQLAGTAIQQDWGFTFPNSGNWLGVAGSIWSVVVSGTSVVLCLRHYFRVGEETKKQQAKWITLGLAFPIGKIVMAELINIFFGVIIPYYSGVSNALLCFFVVYAIWRHDLFNLSPSVAAENIIATMSDAVILTDLRGKTIRVNPSLHDLIDYEERELVGKTIEDLLPETNVTQILNDLHEGRQYKNHETYVRTKRQTQKPVAVSASVVKNSKGRNLGIAFILHDLTRRKLNEERILKNERFAAIGELAGMIGHDLRNPLTSIQAATFYLKRKYGQGMDASGKEMLNTIEQSITYSNKIINDLLDYSRDIKLEPEITNAKSILAKALSVTCLSSNMDIVDQTISSPQVLMDVAKMTRIFSNLIKNAADAMPQGGTLTITSAERQGYLEVSFEDTGSGMTAETLSRLWTPLFTTKAKGMGFGLPICKRIVDAHGGKIRVASTPDKGTKFVLSIPLNSKTPEKTVEPAEVITVDGVLESPTLRAD